jgi:hypothetical protein
LRTAAYDHKFDPIPIQDYYPFTASSSASIERTVQLEKNPPETKEYAEFKKGYTTNASPN